MGARSIYRREGPSVALLDRPRANSRPFQSRAIGPEGVYMQFADVEAPAETALNGKQT